jgi:hypothetical protein
LYLFSLVNSLFSILLVVLFAVFNCFLLLLILDSSEFVFELVSVFLLLALIDGGVSLFLLFVIELELFNKEDSGTIR